MSRWGEDPKKYVIERTRLDDIWVVWPPGNSDPIFFSSFRKACEWFIWRTERND